MDFISAILIIGIAQGLFTMSLVLLRSGISKAGNVSLLVIILFLIWLQAEFLSVRWPYDVGIMLFYGTRYGSWLLLGPLLLWYVRSITHFTISASFAFHFVPFIVLAIIVPLLFSVTLSQYQVHYGMLNVFNNFGFVYTPVQWFYSWVFIFQFVHFTIYTIISLRILNVEEGSMTNSYAGDAVLNIRWLRKFGSLLLVAMIFVVVFLCILFFTGIYRRETDYMYVLPLTFIMYAISYRLTSATWPERVKTSKKYEKSSLSSAQATEYRTLLEKYMIEKKPYLNNGLKLSDLSDALGIPSHHLSRVVNETLGKSFFDYVNEKRVIEAKSLIENGDKGTLLEIAYKAGFNNKNSFTNAFKKNIGVTPSVYKQNYNHSNN